MEPSTSRRSFLGGFAAACTSVLAGCSRSAAVPTDQHWTQAGYDAANTAHNPVARGPTEDPDLAWIHLAGSYYSRSTQILVTDSVYANTGFAGVYAFDPKTGAVRWHDPTDYKELTPTLVDSGLVLPGSYGFRRVATDGGVSVFGHRLGYQTWRTNFTAYPQSPASISNGMLVAGVGTTGHSVGGGRVMGLDAADGTVQWEFPIDSSVWGTPAVGDGTVYAAQRHAQHPEADAIAYAIDASDGSRQWTHEFGSSPRFDPVDAPVVWEDEDLVYVPMELGPLVALDAQTGESIWSHEAASGSGVPGSPALADGRLYVGDLDGMFHALDAVTGDVLWSVGEYGKWFSGPVVTGDSVSEHRVFAVDGDGPLVSFDTDGTERWQEKPIHRYEPRRWSPGTTSISGQAMVSSTPFRDKHQSVWQRRRRRALG